MRTVTTVGEAAAAATAALQGATGTPRQDAYTLLGLALGGVRRETLLAHPERALDAATLARFEQLVSLRKQGMPLAYLIGRRAFYDREFALSTDVLIPRPETEHVVELALEWASAHHPNRVIDVGTGSGVIAVTLAAHLPDARVYGTDISLAALRVARHNSAGLTNLYLAQSDLLTAFSGPFEVICANLPYIANAELDLLEVAKFEPLVALDGGADGLLLIRLLLAQAPRRLAQPGLLLLEHGADQGAAVAALAAQSFPDASIRVVKDLAGLDRVTRIERISVRGG
jgi:release factor glutamine methyltransferase